MTTITRRASTGRLRTLGLITLVTSLLGVACAAAIIAWPRQVDAGQFSYPFDPATFTAAQIVFAVQHLGMFAGGYGLVLIAWRRASRATRAGLVIVLVGAVLITACELFAITAAHATVGSPRADAVESSYGPPTILMGIGLLLAGAGLARQRTLPSWGRWITLALGGWVFVPMLPGLFGPMVVGRIVIGGWLLLFAALGVALMRAASAPRVAP